MGRLSVLSPRRLVGELEDPGASRLPALVRRQLFDGPLLPDPPPHLSPSPLLPYQEGRGSARIPSCAGRNDDYLMSLTKEIN